MATIRKRGSKWQVQIRREGHPPISKSFLQKSDAQLWARQTEARVERAELPESPAKLKGIRFEDVIVRYRDEVAARKQAAPIERVILDAFLRQPLAKLSLAELRPEGIAAYRDRRLQTVKPATVHRELGLLRHVLKIAKAEWGIPLLHNPFAAVELPRLRNQRQRRLKGDELERLRGAVGRLRNRELVSVFEFAIETGMRRGEIVGMRWRDVDQEGRTLHIPKSKNGHPRTIPLTERALAILDARTGSGGEQVFSISANAIRLAWARLRNWANVDDLHFHDLRHEAISRFFEKGLSMPEVALISGHRDPRMLFRYTHLQAEELARKLSAIAQSEQRPVAKSG